MISKAPSERFVMYLAVLPKYRTECMQILANTIGGKMQIFISDAHLDESVRSGIPANLYTGVSIKRVFGKKAFIQFGAWVPAISANTTVLDLNPRSITAWIILVVRALIGRRTLVWGHIHPQAGADAKTAVLRRTMRRLSDGTISYTYRDAEKANADMPGRQVWIAPNSLYREQDISPATSTSEIARNCVLYVGRFAPAKKVAVLIQGFAEAIVKQPDMKLVLVGGGSDEGGLRRLVSQLGIEDNVEFPGWIDELQKLAPFYQRAFCTVSPGFAGLGLTQSLGFGVPMLVSDNEPHSPEIELDSSGGVTYFPSGSTSDLCKALLSAWESREKLPDHFISEYTRRRYSAEAMAGGLQDALENRRG